MTEEPSLIERLIPILRDNLPVTCGRNCEAEWTDAGEASAYREAATESAAIFAAEIARLEGEVERLTHERDVAYEGQLRDARYRAVAEQQAEDAESALSAAETRAEKAEGGRDAALRELTKYAREAGEAKGRLEMSEAAGIVDGWRERAQLAEGREKALVEALTAAIGFYGEVGGTALGVAMSGSDHPNPDGVLMALFEKSQAMTKDARAALPHVQSKEGLGDASVGGVQAAPDGATYEPRPAGQWQPIATAPTNRITVLLRDAEGAHYAGYFFDDYWSSVCGQPAVYPVDPTHWMPLPAPPSSDPHPSDGGRG